MPQCSKKVSIIMNGDQIDKLDRFVDYPHGISKSALVRFLISELFAEPRDANAEKLGSYIERKLKDDDWR